MTQEIAPEEVERAAWEIWRLNWKNDDFARERWDEMVELHEMTRAQARAAIRSYLETHKPEQEKGG